MNRPDRQEIEAEASDAATKARRRLGLPGGAIVDLVAAVECLTGDDVAIVEAADGDHGLTMRDRATGREILAVSTMDNPLRQRSILAHEFAHHVFRDHLAATADLSIRTREESRADTFARHFLIPLGDVGALRSPVDVSALSSLVERYLVSPAIAAIQLREVGLIDEATKKEWMGLDVEALAVRFGWIDAYRTLQAGSMSKRAPRRLLARAISAYEQGLLGVEAVASLRGVDPQTMLLELERAGIRPAEEEAVPDDDSVFDALNEEDPSADD